MADVLYQPEESVPLIQPSTNEQLIQKADSTPVYTPQPSVNFETGVQQGASYGFDKIQTTTATVATTYEGLSPTTKNLFWAFLVGFFLGKRR